MRLFAMSLCLVVVLAACAGSTTSSSKPTPGRTFTGSFASTDVLPRATRNPNATPFPTQNPHQSPQPLPTVRAYKPLTPTPFPATAYRSVVYGTVMLAKSHKPVAAATVIVAEGQRRTTTDGKGRYRIAFPSKVPVSVQVKKQGYQCPLVMGILIVGQNFHENFQCTRVHPGQPAPPPFPGTFGHMP